MKNDLITEASKLFPTLEHWQGFLDLSALTVSIKESWLTEATSRIRRHFMTSLDSQWAFEPFGAPLRDTRWFLKDYGSDSLALYFTNYYRLSLGVWNPQNFKNQPVVDALKTSEYGSILVAFGRIDQQNTDGLQLIQHRDFSFASCDLKHLSESDLAWCAAHETDLLVAQAIEKIERFTNDPSVTGAIRRLNDLALETRN
ncbi:MAG: hypothetical protein EOP85_01500 [Verrucomicrobiaceae bacterium]|nr:MAG: hypothetical protein EOP85_01500 [Verrucomicrobiaceae bacterium]